MLGADAFLPLSRDADGSPRRLTARDVNWAHAYATTFPERLPSRGDHVWRSASASLLLGVAIPLIGHWGFGWSIPWMLIALGIDLIGLWVADLVRMHAFASGFDQAVSDLVARRHAVATARALFDARSTEPRLRSPDPLRDNARFFRLWCWFSPFPLLPLIAIIAGWHFAPRQSWGTLQLALLLSPFLIRPTEALLDAWRVRRGAEGAASLLPRAPAGMLRVLWAALIYVWLAMWTVDLFGLGIFDRHGAVAALLLLTASTAAFSALEQLRNRRDVEMLRRLAHRDRSALVARFDGIGANRGAG